MKSRGQVTVFVVLGIILFVVIVLSFFILSQSFTDESREAAATGDVPGDVANVEAYVTSTLEEAVSTAVVWCGQLDMATGDANCPDDGTYDDNLKAKIKEVFCFKIYEGACGNTFTVGNQDVTASAVNPSVDLVFSHSVSGERELLKVTMEYLISANKGGKKFVFGSKDYPFYTEFNYKVEGCAQVPLEGDGTSCIADDCDTTIIDEYEVTMFGTLTQTFKEGEFVGDYPTACWACPNVPCPTP